jgi:peroxiredoxin
VKVDPVRLGAVGVVFAGIIGLLAWKGASALPGEIEREQREICLPLEPDPGWKVRPAQDFTLKDYAGRPISLSAYRGRVVFLNFWATWCPPCRDEMDSMERLALRMGEHKDFAMLAVSEDKSWDDVRRFFAGGSRMTILMDEEFRTAHSWGTEKLPETYLIDKQGQVRHYVINKRNWATPQAVACIESLLD